MLSLVRMLNATHSGRLGPKVVHRDLKPENLLLRNNGSLAVADWGCSWAGQRKVAEEGSRVTATMGTILGTVPYMAPEMTEAALEQMLAAKRAERLGGAGAAAAMAASGDVCSSTAFDASLDVYAAGVTTIELLLGGPMLFEGVAAGFLGSMEREHRVAMFVLGAIVAPAGVNVSAAARDFVGCCCGLGRAEAVARGEAARMSPAQLLQHPWLAGLEV
jgi:serine/threonine protein kinase